MVMKIGKVLAGLAVAAVVGGAAWVGVGALNSGGTIDANNVSNNTQLQGKPTTKDVINFKLAPSNDKLADCLPKVKVNISVALRTDATGRDIFKADISGAPKNISFTIFLLERPDKGFGAAEYIGDLNTDKYGRGHVELRLIVEEAFSSTLVNEGTDHEKRVRKELDHVGMWFADQKDDDFCLGANSPVTPFDGDNEAGVQVFNSAQLKDAPLP
jgi:hypothetical protein